MIRKLPIIALLLVIAACDQQGRNTPPANDVADAPDMPKAAAEVPSLDGEWRVTMIGGIDASALGMTATLGAGRASLATSCFRRAWTYSQQRNVVDFTTSASGSSNCGGQAPGAREETAYAALEDANLVIFGKDGAEATLSGTGGTLTLERR